MLTPIHSSVPVVCTDSIEKSLSYYIDTLGFLRDFCYGDPPIYAGVKSGIAEIYFTIDAHFVKAIAEKKLNPEIFLWIPDAETYFNFHVAKGAEIFEPISDRPWGARQYVIRDINGYHLKFAQPL
jgi:uncharacterized glyoxalase superfamily protein PhnB